MLLARGLQLDRWNELPEFDADSLGDLRTTRHELSVVLMTLSPTKADFTRH